MRLLAVRFGASVNVNGRELTHVLGEDVAMMASSDLRFILIEQPGGLVRVPMSNVIWLREVPAAKEPEVSPGTTDTNAKKETKRAGEKGNRPARKEG